MSEPETALIIISEYDEYKENLRNLKEKADFIPDTTTLEGYETSKRLSLDIAKICTALEKIRKEKKKQYLEGGRAVDAQAKEIEEELRGLQKPHLEAYKKIDNDRKQKQEEIQAWIQAIIFTPTTARNENWDSARTQEEIKALKESTFDYQEQQDNADMVTKKCLDSLNEYLLEVQKKEQDAAELEKFRIEAEKKARAEHEEKLKAEAREKAEAAQKEAEFAQKRAEEQQKQAEQDLKKAKAKAIKDAKQAKKQAEIYAKQAALEAKEAEVKAAENARLAEMSRQAYEQKSAEEAEAKRAANKRHRKKINNEILDYLVGMGFFDDQAKAIIVEMSKNNIPHVKINY